LMAVLLDREIRGSRIYQTVFYLPVVLSLAVIGIIWTLQYAPDQGFINNALGRAGKDPIDWLGDPKLNLWAALVATSWRHVGYIMVLYLAGLKSVDPALREAATVDGANERQTFLHVVFPVMAPINIVIVVVTTIEALRAFDIAYIINGGRNGLELLSTVITNGYISLPSSLSVDNFFKAWDQGNFPQFYLNSLIVTVPAVIVTLLLASMVAFAVSRFSWRFNLVVLMLFTAGNLLPPQVIIVPLYRLYLFLPVPQPLSDNGILYDQFIGIILIHVAFQTGFCVFVLSN